MAATSGSVIGGMGYCMIGLGQVTRAIEFVWNIANYNGQSLLSSG